MKEDVIEKARMLAMKSIIAACVAPMRPEVEEKLHSSGRQLREMAKWMGRQELNSIFEKPPEPGSPLDVNDDLKAVSSRIEELATKLGNPRINQILSDEMMELWLLTTLMDFAVA